MSDVCIRPTAQRDSLGGDRTSGNGPLPLWGGQNQATTRDIQALLERAENATQAGHYDQAEEAYKRFLEIQPDVPTVLNNLGSVFLRTGRYHGAVEYFKRARNLDGNLFQVRLNLAICLYRLERYSEARKEFELYLREDPQNYQANYLAGIVSFSLNDFPVAVNYLERILTARKPDSALLFTLATKLRQDEAAGEGPFNGRSSFRATSRHTPVPSADGTDSF